MAHFNEYDDLTNFDDYTIYDSAELVKKSSIEQRVFFSNIRREQNLPYGRYTENDNKLLESVQENLNNIVLRKLLDICDKPSTEQRTWMSILHTIPNKYIPLNKTNGRTTKQDNEFLSSFKNSYDKCMNELILVIRSITPKPNTLASTKSRKRLDMEDVYDQELSRLELLSFTFALFQVAFIILIGYYIYNALYKDDNLFQMFDIIKKLISN